jgi:RHS repeat-associated protein
MIARKALRGGRVLWALFVTVLALVGAWVSPHGAQAQSSASPYTTGYRWDNLRRIVGIISPDPIGNGSIGFPAVRYTYDVDGNLVKTETGFLASWQDQTVQPANWTGFTIKSVKTETLDAMGNKTQELVADGAGNSLALTQTAYDANDRSICSAVRMNLSTTQTNACALGTAGSYGNDRITTTHYDGDGRVDYTKRAVGSGNEQFYARYGYSANGNKTAETDANGNLTNYVYDGYDRLAYLYYPSLTTGALSSNSADYESYLYDNNGNRTSYRRRNGQTYTYQYDAINQQILKTRSDNTGLNVASSYDLTGHLIQAKFANGSGAVSYSYDAAGRMLTTTDMFNQTLSYQYDAGSLRTLMIFPDNQQQGYQYNTGNQLSWTGIQGSSFGYGVGYDNFDRPATITRSNNANTSIGYDNVDRVTSYGHTFANSNRNVTWGFTLDPASGIVNTTTTNTIYDYREQQSATENHTFNGLNQDSAIAALQTSCATAGAGYDCDGNLTNDSSRQFTYDIDNHLTSLSGPASASYVYDPIGRLAQATVNGVVTRFLYDGSNLVAEYDGSGNIQRRYMHTLGIDQPWVQFTGAAVGASNAKYLYANYQGSIVALADSTGTVADGDIYKYGPYGEPRDINNNLNFSGSRFRYTGQTVLPEASLYYYKARVYDPVFGRFLQTDPIGSKDDLDLYAYVQDDPTDKTDPTGNEAASCYGNNGSACGTQNGQPVTLSELIDGGSYVVGAIEIAIGGGPEDPAGDAAAYGTVRGGKALSAAVRAAEKSAAEKAAAEAAAKKAATQGADRQLANDTKSTVDTVAGKKKSPTFRCKEKGCGAPHGGSEKSGDDGKGGRSGDFCWFCWLKRTNKES